MPTEHIFRSTLPPIDYPPISVGEYLAGCLTAQDENAIAFLHPTPSAPPTTYGSFHNQIHHFASGLIQLGLTSTDFLVFFSDNNHEYTVAWFASAYLGLPLCSVPPSMGPYELSTQIREVGGTVLLFAPNKKTVVEKAVQIADYAESMKSVKMWIQFESESDQDFFQISGTLVHSFSQISTLGYGKLLPLIPHFPVSNTEQPFAIFFTSGSTGTAKGVIHTHRSFLAMLLNYRLPPTSQYGSRIVIPFPLGHISGSIFMPVALAAGMTVLFVRYLPVEQILELVDRHRIDQYIFSANAAGPLVGGEFPHLDLTCLKAFSYGGSKIAGNILDRIQSKYSHVTLFEFYGSTEFMGSVSAIFGPSHRSLGILCPGVQAKIVDLKDLKSSLPPGASGEIYFRGEPCFAGYLKNEAETAKAIDADRWFRTGDVGYFDSTGRLYLTDRIKELIKFRAYSVFPVEIEEFLYHHPAVEAACVVGVAHQTDGQLPRAYVQLKDGVSDLAEDDLVQFVRENCGSHKWLRGGVHFIQQMRRTTIGKVDRQYYKHLVKMELITAEVD